MGRCIFRVCGLVPHTFLFFVEKVNKVSEFGKAQVTKKIDERGATEMAMIKCVDCGWDISDSSKTCPHCGCATKKSILAEQERKNQEQWNNLSPREKKIYTIITIAIIVLVSVFLFKACSGSTKEDDYNTESRAKVCAEMAVEDRLKSPSTAKFCPSYEMTATNLGGDRWKVTGYVDAQNSFGAEIRESWTVVFTLTEAGYKECTVSFS